MRKIFYLCALAIYTSPINAMTTECFPYYDDLAPEIQWIIIDCAINKCSTNKPKIAAKTINALARTNKQLNSDINNPLFSDKLIKNHANKYGCSHESIAKFIHTKQTKNRLFFQYDLKKLCCKKNKRNATLKLSKLVTNGIDLEFTYNHLGKQKTPLMMSMSYDNTMFDCLLDHGANINNSNSYGLTALHLALTHPIKNHYYLQLISNPKLAINQCTQYGENALLYCLTHIKELPLTGYLRGALISLIQCGIDPTHANKKKITPLKAAQKIDDQRIIRTIELAIEKKTL